MKAEGDAAAEDEGTATDAELGAVVAPVVDVNPAAAGIAEDDISAGDGEDISVAVAIAVDDAIAAPDPEDSPVVIVVIAVPPPPPAAIFSSPAVTVTGIYSNSVPVKLEVVTPGNSAPAPPTLAVHIADVVPVSEQCRLAEPAEPATSVMS